MEGQNENGKESFIFGRAQLVLAEKRTSLATLRTGIAVLVLPLSVISFLIATSTHYDFFQVLHLMLPILILCFALVLVGSYLIVNAIIRIHRQDKLLTELKQSQADFARFID